MTADDLKKVLAIFWWTLRLLDIATISLLRYLQ
jgi:hypothetical protein